MVDTSLIPLTCLKDDEKKDYYIEKLTKLMDDDLSLKKFKSDKEEIKIIIETNDLIKIKRFYDNLIGFLNIHNYNLIENDQYIDACRRGILYYNMNTKGYSGFCYNMFKRIINHINNNHIDQIRYTYESEKIELKTLFPTNCKIENVRKFYYIVPNLENIGERKIQIMAENIYFDIFISFDSLIKDIKILNKLTIMLDDFNLSDQFLTDAYDNKIKYSDAIKRNNKNYKECLYLEYIHFLTRKKCIIYYCNKYKKFFIESLDTGEKSVCVQMNYIFGITIIDINKKIQF